LSGSRQVADQPIDILGGADVQEAKSWACPTAPPDLQMRDELGRLNQRFRAGENIALSVTVHRFDKGGIWTTPTAYYELVARDPQGELVWTADDRIEARDNWPIRWSTPPARSSPARSCAMCGRFWQINS
jgi:hypothetical protein